jgi:hypothetical protein
MQSPPLFFTARIKSLPGSPRTASAKVWADSLSKRRPHCRSYFISRFFGWRAVGISNTVRKEFSIPFLPASASARARSHFFSSFKKAGRFLLYRRFWPVAQRSWPSQEFYFFANPRPGSGSSALRLQSQDCFCCADDLRRLGSARALAEMKKIKSAGDRSPKKVANSGGHRQRARHVRFPKPASKTRRFVRFGLWRVRYRRRDVNVRRRRAGTRRRPPRRA